jgi:DnaJ family protein A protein 2
MFFGGGFPFPPQQQQRGPIDNEGLYKKLGLTKTASDIEIKKAYRKLALQHHPDRKNEDGCQEKFKDIGSAYEVLSDPDKKRAYDQHGEAAVNDGQGDGHAGNGMNPADLFNMFFNGTSKKNKGEDIVHPLRVSLEDLYRGKTFKLSINRDVICTGCDGVGGPPEALSTCMGCQGKGFQTAYRQIGPGMMQKLQGPCPICKGECKIMKGDAVCTKCNGNKVVKEQKVLSVEVPPGTLDNHRFVFTGGSDCAPGVPPGDVIFVIQTIEHATFKRKEDDLLMDFTLNITEALCGFDISIPNIDGTAIRLISEQGEVTRPDTVHMITGAGMVTKEGSRGKMYIHFHVTFPDRLGDTERLLQCLPPVPGRILTSNEQIRKSVKVKVDAREANNGSCAQM